MSIPPPPGPFPPPDPQSRQGPYPAPPQPPYPHPTPYSQPQAYPHPQAYPYAFPFPPPAPQPPLNGVAVASLVFGVLCLLPGVGLVLGLVALAQIRRKGERGRSLAVTGAALSSAGVLLWALVLGTGAASSFWDGVKEGVRDGASFSLDEGDCFDTPSGSLQGVTYDVDTVPCSGEHDGEVFATVTLPDGDGDYPGDDHVTGVADEKCYSLMGYYALDSWAVPDDVDVYYLAPTSESWRLGDREITCVFGDTDEGGKLTGSLRHDGADFDVDQLAYLEAVRAVDLVLDTEPEEYPEDDLPGNRKWAKEVEEVLGEQADVLRDHTWRSDTEQPLTALLEELESARGHWRKAGTATDPETYWEHYDKAYGFYDGEATVTAREALGLDTSPPAYLYGEDPGEATGDV
ncbi:DUF4190 domain-containing protein [Streptomyces sp. NPDC006997]|uniref:DUF4190 domain-containing protein n=1 Tax=Streptomyces sp. NPDC006997 TaxID=3155356 RepID=UPI0033FE5519